MTMPQTRLSQALHSRAWHVSVHVIFGLCVCAFVASLLSKRGTTDEWPDYVEFLSPGITLAPIELDNDTGLETQALTILAFVDFQCPFCKQHDRDVAPSLRKISGINYVVRHFPLSE